jgi:hypothetical protein
VIPSRIIRLGILAERASLSAYGLTVNITVFPTVLAVARMLVVETAETSAVVMVNVPEVAPAGMMKLGWAGLATDEFVVVSATVTSPGAAAHSRVAVPVTLAGPTTGLGLKVSVATPIGRTVRVEDLLTPP